MAAPDSEVGKLLLLHKPNIDQLLARYAPQYQSVDIATPFDPLFALRFLLSTNGELELASKRMKECLEWRTANRAQLGTVPHQETFAKHMKRGRCGGWINDQYLLYVIRAGQADSIGLVKALTNSELKDSLLFSYEINFQLVDRKTRETGRLCKVISVLDLQQFSMFRYDKKFAKANGEVSTLSSVLYPQLLGMLVVINLPTVFKLLFGVAQVFMSKETLAKIKLCRASNTLKQSATACPFLTKFTDVDAITTTTVPDFLGGKLPCPHALQFD